jgi:SEL1 protein
MAADQQHNAQAMFNLGYMHEQGLGMKKDIHLAKRSYDLAAETNADAKIPVALALLKLQFVYKVETWKNENPFKLLMGLDENIASNWDLYLITFGTIVLGIIIYSRRPPNQLVQENPAPERRENPTESQPSTSSQQQVLQNPPNQGEGMHEVQ